MALTFDDGPSGALTERLLDGLAARDVKATFSCRGLPRGGVSRAATADRRGGTCDRSAQRKKHDICRKWTYEGGAGRSDALPRRGRGMLRHAGTAVPPARRTLQQTVLRAEQQIGPFADPLVGRSRGIGTRKAASVPGAPKESFSGQRHPDARSARKLGGRGADGHRRAARAGLSLLYRLGAGGEERKTALRPGEIYSSFRPVDESQKNR